MDAVSLREKIAGDWFFRGGAWWRLEPIAGIRTIASQMLQGEARFATIVATSAADRSLRVSWHWDVFGTLLSVESLLPPGGLMPTIADIYPGADWAERETRDYFAVEFEGRDHTPPLMLRDTDRPGILLESKGAVR
jgi:NADH-quinone oxidoreductase subunit C